MIKIQKRLFYNNAHRTTTYLQNRSFQRGLSADNNSMHNATHILL